MSRLYGFYGNIWKWLSACQDFLPTIRKPKIETKSLNRFQSALNQILVTICQIFGTYTSWIFFRGGRGGVYPGKSKALNFVIRCTKQKQLQRTIFVSICFNLFLFVSICFEDLRVRNPMPSFTFKLSCQILPF